MNPESTCCHSPRSDKRHSVFLGAVLVLGGMLFLLEHLGALGAWSAWDFWPLVLVLGGLRHLAGVRGRGNRLGGLVLAIAGLALLGTSLHAFDLRWDLVWPVAIIALGVACIGTVVTRSAAPLASSAARADGKVILGSREERNDSPAFEGGDIQAVMGSYELDLSGAKIQSEEAHLFAKAVMGSVEIRVPAGWRVKVEGTPVLGAIEDQIRPADDPAPDAKILVVHANAVMGAVEIRTAG